MVHTDYRSYLELHCSYSDCFSRLAAGQGECSRSVVYCIGFHASNLPLLVMECIYIPARWGACHDYPYLSRTYGLAFLHSLYLDMFQTLCFVI